MTNRQRNVSVGLLRLFFTKYLLVYVLCSAVTNTVDIDENKSISDHLKDEDFIIRGLPAKLVEGEKIYPFRQISISKSYSFVFRNGHYELVPDKNKDFNLNEVSPFDMQCESRKKLDSNKDGVMMFSDSKTSIKHKSFNMLAASKIKNSSVKKFLSFRGSSKETAVKFDSQLLFSISILNKICLGCLKHLFSLSLERKDYDLVDSEISISQEFLINFMNSKYNPFFDYIYRKNSFVEKKSRYLSPKIDSRQGINNKNNKDHLRASDSCNTKEFDLYLNSKIQHLTSKCDNFTFKEQLNDHSAHKSCTTNSHKKTGFRNFYDPCTKAVSDPVTKNGTPVNLEIKGNRFLKRSISLQTENNSDFFPLQIDELAEVYIFLILLNEFLLNNPYPRIQKICLICQMKKMNFFILNKIKNNFESLIYEDYLESNFRNKTDSNYVFYKKLSRNIHNLFFLFQPTDHLRIGDSGLLVKNILQDKFNAPKDSSYQNLEYANMQKLRLSVKPSETKQTHLSTLENSDSDEGENINSCCENIHACSEFLHKPFEEKKMSSGLPNHINEKCNELVKDDLSPIEILSSPLTCCDDNSTGSVKSSLNLKSKLLNKLITPKYVRRSSASTFNQVIETSLHTFSQRKPCNFLNKISRRERLYYTTSRNDSDQGIEKITINIIHLPTVSVIITDSLEEKPSFESNFSNDFNETESKLHYSKIDFKATQALKELAIERRQMYSNHRPSTGSEGYISDTTDNVQIVVERIFVNEMRNKLETNKTEINQKYIYYKYPNFNIFASELKEDEIVDVAQTFIKSIFQTLDDICNDSLKMKAECEEKLRLETPFNEINDDFEDIINKSSVAVKNIKNIQKALQAACKSTIQPVEL